MNASASAVFGRIAAGLLLVLAGPAALAAELSLHLPLNRTAYQCNELIDISIIRSAPAALNAGDLVLQLKGEDGSRLGFTFPVAQAAAGPTGARAAEHLHVNGWLLRPGAYMVDVTCDGASAATNITLYTHLRQSSFKLINWGTAKGRDQLAEGEENLGFNLYYGHYAADEEANFMRAGVDFMACCVMSGGHQMDLRQECDWSDPYVIRGGTRRVVKRAFIDRTRPNVWGVHFYDEPGLTWGKDAQTGEMAPHAVPWQLRSYEAAFGDPMIRWKDLDPTNPDQAARWDGWARWKLGLMDAAWKDSQFGVAQVRPDYVSVTQSQYGYSAFTDGYYFNVVRSLPVISGHGGYHDWGPGYFNPSMFLEFARAHDLTRPNWYLPTWYGSTTADEFRLEQYLSFQCNIQGLISPPEIEPAQPAKSKAAQGVVESNHLLARLGTIFEVMPVTRPPVALLFSLSHMIHAQALDRKVCYAHDLPHGRNVPFTYLAGKLLQQQFLPVLDEEVLDGTLAAQHRAIILTSIDYLDPAVVAGLEDFARNGGLVLLTADCTVKVNGAVKLDVKPELPDAARIAELKAAGKAKEAADLGRMRQELAGARKLADAIKPHLDKAGLRPPVASSEPGLVVTRQAAGDLEYLFVVNATHDPEGNPMLGMKAMTATLALPDDGRPVYDAVQGSLAWEFVPGNGRLEGEFRFGPGQMRVFARTARPIGAVRVGTPVLRRDYTLAQAPLWLEVSAAVLDAKGALLAGAVPLRIQVTEPSGAVRYELFRATDHGLFRLSLPLALNDPAGEWKVQVTELLAGKSDTAAVALSAVSTCSAAAGATPRAVCWPQDRDNVFRFFRTHHKVTLVLGNAPYHGAAAERLARIIAPWNVQCATVNATEVNKPRALSADEAATWIGLDYAGRGQIKPGSSNSLVQAGFAVDGPVILLGTPEDNPLIRFLAEQRFLPYKPARDIMPGAGRGYVAWQRDGIGVNQESITLIAYDEKGLAEAVGTLYQMLAGQEPLAPITLPVASRMTPATGAAPAPEPAVQWSVELPDRIEAIQAREGKITALTHASVLAELKPDGSRLTRRYLEASDYQNALRDLAPKADASLVTEWQKKSPTTRLVKRVVGSGDRTAVAYWGGRLDVFDGTGALKASRRCPQDITALAWAEDRLLVGDADGRLMALSFK